MSSVKGNIILNGINTVTGIIFPMITFPYAARILLPEGIGAVNFLSSIINYIVLLTSLGIPLYAVKEVAKYQHDKDQRDKNTIEILILSTILCLIGYIGVWLLAKYIPEIHQQSTLFFVLSLSIIFNTIGVTWFYQGIEDFKFITIRAIIIRTICALCLFLFVKNSGDLLTYGFITVGSTVGNNFINFIHLRSYINWKTIKFSELRVLRHIKPSLHIFILNIITSLYIHLNSVMIGFMQGDKEVGYFTAGTRITHIGLALITSIGTVLLPRGTNLLKKKDLVGFKSIISKSVRLTIALSLPMIMGLIILAIPVTLVFCGPDYIDSIPILYLNAPVILLIGLTNVMGIQILYPKNKINLVILSVTGGAIGNILLNIILIPSYGATGAAISTLFAELLVLLLQLFLGNRYYPFRWKEVFKSRYILSTIIMGIAILPIHYIVKDTILQLLIGIPLGALIYGVCLFLVKDDIMEDVLNVFKKRH